MYIKGGLGGLKSGKHCNILYFLDEYSWIKDVLPFNLTNIMACRCGYYSNYKDFINKDLAQT